MEKFYAIFDRLADTKSLQVILTQRVAPLKIYIL